LTRSYTIFLPATIYGSVIEIVDHIVLDAAVSDSVIFCGTGTVCFESTTAAVTGRVTAREENDRADEYC
jgi:hypothetical protein